jgi:hypothetical protein
MLRFFVLFFFPFPMNNSHLSTFNDFFAKLENRNYI